jgi:hypothetical protein
MDIRPRTTMKNIYGLAAAAALVATPAAFASAADAPPESAAPAGATAPTIAPGARYQLVDANGNVVGELVSETGTRLRLRPIGVTTAVRNAPKTAAPARSDRAFHPDYSRALTTGQMSAAWQTEWDRINPPIVTGGG